MAKNKVIVTAGEALKKEGALATGQSNIRPGSFVDFGTGGYAIAGATTKEVAIVDYTSVDGMDFGVTKYNAGDQIPVVYPETGAEVNVLVDTTGAVNILKGEQIIISNGKALNVNPATGGNIIGKAKEAVEANKDAVAKIKVEVLAVPYFAAGSSTDLTGFMPMADVDAGVAGDALADAAAVQAILPDFVWGLFNGGSIKIPVTAWVDTDTYNKSTAKSYTFTGTLGDLPTGITNTGSLAPTVEVVVSAA